MAMTDGRDRFIPCHTLETFPKEMAGIRDAGHEMYCNQVFSVFF